MQSKQYNIVMLKYDYQGLFLKHNAKDKNWYKSHVTQQMSIWVIYCDQAPVEIAHLP